VQYHPMQLILCHKWAVTPEDLVIILYFEARMTCCSKNLLLDPRWLKNLQIDLGIYKNKLFGFLTVKFEMINCYSYQQLRKLAQLHLCLTANVDT